MTQDEIKTKRLELVEQVVAVQRRLAELREICNHPRKDIDSTSALCEDCGKVIPILTPLN